MSDGWTRVGNAQMRIPSLPQPGPEVPPIVPARAVTGETGAHRGPTYTGWTQPGGATFTGDSTRQFGIFLPINIQLDERSKLLTCFQFAGGTSDKEQAQTLEREHHRAHTLLNFHAFLIQIVHKVPLRYVQSHTHAEFLAGDWVEGIFQDGTARLGQAYQDGYETLFRWGADAVSTDYLEIGERQDSVQFLFEAERPGNNCVARFWAYHLMHVFFTGDIVGVMDRANNFHTALIIAVVRELPPRQYQLVVLSPTNSGHYEVSVQSARQIYALLNLKLCFRLHAGQYPIGLITRSELEAIADGSGSYAPRKAPMVNR